MNSKILITSLALCLLVATSPVGTSAIVDADAEAGVATECSSSNSSADAYAGNKGMSASATMKGNTTSHTNDGNKAHVWEKAAGDGGSSADAMSKTSAYRFEADCSADAAPVEPEPEPEPEPHPCDDLINVMDVTVGQVLDCASRITGSVADTTTIGCIADATGQPLKIEGNIWNDEAGNMYLVDELSGGVYAFTGPKLIVSGLTQPITTLPDSLAPTTSQASFNFEVLVNVVSCVATIQL